MTRQPPRLLTKIMKVKFTQDYSSRKAGDVVEYDDRFARDFLIKKGYAKKFTTRKTKEEKSTKLTKDA